MDRLLPILQPHDCQGKVKAATRPLSGPEGMHALLVSYAQVNPTTNAYLTYERLKESGMSLAAVEAQALANLRKREHGNWTPLEPREGIQILVLRHDELTSSQILCREIVQRAHDSFGASALHIAAPDRHTLLAADDPVIMPALAQRFYDEAVAEHRGPLSAGVYVFVQGEPTGILNVNVDGGEKEPARDADEIASLYLGPLCVFFLVAGADGKVDKKETFVFLSFLRDRAAMASPEVRALLHRAAGGLDEIQERFEHETPLSVLIQWGRAIGLLTPAVAGEYKEVLVDLAREVAAASGGFLGFGSRARKKQRVAIDLIRSRLQLFSGVSAEGGEEDLV